MYSSSNAEPERGNTKVMVSRRDADVCRAGKVQLEGRYKRLSASRIWVQRVRSTSQRLLVNGRLHLVQTSI